MANGRGIDHQLCFTMLPMCQILCGVLGPHKICNLEGCSLGEVRTWYFR